MNTIISARNLSKKYGSFKALDNIDLDIAPGRIIGLIGPNGAGKTTLLKALLGLTNYDGSLSVLGLNPFSERHKLMQDISFIADVAVLPKWIRVDEILDFVQSVHPRFSRGEAEKHIRRTKIKLRHKISELSKGMVAQLHLALVMAIDAKLLVLDEPTLGLDILFRKEFYDNLLNDYFDHQRTILVTTHQVEEVEHILTDLLFIRSGRIVLDASMDEIVENYFEVMVRPDSLEQARRLEPLTERTLFNKHIMLFRHQDKAALEQLGEIRRPGVADLFVALLKEEEQ